MGSTRRLLKSVGVFVFIFGAVGEAHAQSENTLQLCQDNVDNDQDGYVDCTDQDCGGFCAQPPPQLQPNTAAPAYTPATPPQRPPSAGWSLAGAILGYSFAGITIALGAGAEATKQEDIPAIPLGVSSLILTCVFTPLVHGSARSAIRSAGVRGCPGCMIAGWVTFALSMSGYISMITYNAVADVTPAHGILASSALFGAISTILMATHALAARNQVRRQTTTQATRNDSRLSIAPLVSPYSSQGDGVDGVVFGLSVVR